MPSRQKQTPSSWGGLRKIATSSIPFQPTLKWHLARVYKTGSASAQGACYHLANTRPSH
ncbi:hypothetical protein N9101_01865 [Akkermansiaceae bacterium]|nr:hypothetical protein [Akkermansiaceae bacterium]